LNKAARLSLIILTGFLSLTAMGGGIGLVTNIMAPPVQDLQGSSFKSYLVPGLALFLIVGGGALATMILLIRLHPIGSLASILAGIIIIGFETVEIWVIGSPAGLARSLQVFYLSLGILIVILGTWLLAFNRPAQTRPD
jgi:hypothetical protein